MSTLPEPPASLTSSLPPIEAWSPHLDDDLGRSWFVEDLRVVESGPLIDHADTTEVVWSTAPTPAGAPADRPDQHPRPDALAHHVGVALRRLHDEPLETAPSVDALAAVRSVIRRRVADASIDVADLPEPYRRHDADRLLELMDIGLAERLADRPVVPVHGRPVLGRFFVDPDGSTSLVDGPLGWGDAHLDLAICHRAVHETLGPGAVFEFYDGYGSEPDLVLLDRFTLAALLR